MSNSPHFNPYDGAHVDQGDWAADQGYHKEQRRVTIDKTIRSGVVNSGLIQTDSLKVYADSYKTNAHFIDNRSFIDGNPLTIKYGDNIRKAIAQKFIARSNNIQKIRLWMNTDLKPGMIMGHVIVEIRELQGTDCECDCRCTCSSTITDKELLNSDPKNSALASVKLDHNQINNQSEFVDIPFFLQDRVANPESLVVGRPYAIVVYRDHLPAPQTGYEQSLRVNGNFNGEGDGSQGYATVFDPARGTWVDQTSNNVGYQIFSNTVLVSFGYGISEGQGYSIPRTASLNTGATVDYFYGNIDLVHFDSLSVAGEFIDGGNAVGRNVIIARAIEELTDLEPHPRTGNQTFSRVTPTFDVQVVTEKDWNDPSIIDQCEWNLLAYATDENRKTIRGEFDEPCEQTPLDLVGNWVPSLINIEDCRALLPHSKLLRYGEFDPSPVSPEGISGTDTNRITVFDPGDTIDLYQSDSVKCVPCQQTAFDSGNGLILTDATGGKHVLTVGTDGALRSESLIPPPVTGLKVVKDETSVANDESQTGICCVDNGLRLRLTWNYPPANSYEGVVVVRCVNDYPRSPSEGTIIASTHEQYTISSTGKVLDFSPLGGTNTCPLCDTPTSSGIVGDEVGDSTDDCGCYIDSFGGVKLSTLATGCGTSSEAAITAEQSTGLSDNVIYHYAVFTYNRFGHFSAPSICSQASYGIIDTIPPGGACDFLVSPTTVNSAEDAVSITWTNPDDSDFVGVRIYKSNSAYVRDFHYEGNDAEIVYDTNLFDSAGLSFSTNSPSLTPSGSSEFVDNSDNRFVNNADGSYSHDTTNNRYAFRFIGGRFTLSRSTLGSGTHYYSIFTYDASGNFSISLCDERDRVVL